MAATLNQIADLIAYRLGSPFDGMLIESIKFSIKYWRAMLIRQDVERNGTSRDFLQRFVVNLIKVDIGDTCVVDVGTTVLRSELIIPKPVRLKQPVPFKYVGEVGGGDSWTHTELEELKYTAHNKYTSNIVRYTYVNNYIYVYCDLKYKFMAIEGVFVDPSTAVTYCINSTECVSDDDPFPIGDDMLKALVEGLIRGEFEILTKANDVTVLTPKEEGQENK